MKETEIALRNHRTAVLSHTSHFERCPNGVAREKLIVSRNTGKLHHTELHHKVIDKLLCLGLGECAFVKVSLDIYIEESGDTSNRHCRTILRFNGTQIAKVKPLHGLASVVSRSRNVVTVNLGHLFQFFQCLNLH